MNRKESFVEWIAAFLMVAFSIIGVFIVLLLITGVYSILVSITNFMKDYWIHIILFTLFGLPITGWIYELFKKEKQ